MSDSRWFSVYSTKLVFFARIRRFLQRKTAWKKVAFIEKAKITVEDVEMGVSVVVEEEKEEDSFVLQRYVKKLHFGCWAEKEVAAKEISRLAAEDLKTRKSLAGLGVIPALVSMLGSESPGCRRSAAQALVELGNGTHTNKILMVEAGILTRMPQLVIIKDPSWTHDLVALLFSLSAAAPSQFLVPTPDIIRFLGEVLNSGVSSKTTKLACLNTLHNLSTVLDHATSLVSSGTIQTLTKLSSDKEASEKALATIGNLVVSIAGKQAVEADPNVPNSFIEVLTWEDKPKCQELSLYILMMLAHGSSVQREKMAKVGIVQVLLEVVLLGSPLAQKRAIKILQWFKNERQKKIGRHSGPQTGRILTGLQVSTHEIKEGKIAIKQMVKQSLDKNMELIMRRAQASPDNPKLKSLLVSSSSKSLSY